MAVELVSGPTLGAAEIDLDEPLTFVRSDGRRQVIRVTRSWARIHSTDLAEPRKATPGASTVLRAHVQLDIDGTAVQLVRWIGCDRSFADPWRIAGLELWFDGNTDLFEHLNDNHGGCRPRKRVRLAVWEAGRRLCPVLLHPWCPLPADGLRIADCYDGHDSWMGPYFGADAHGGLDINHPAGTVLHAPLAIHRHRFFAHIREGAENNRWRGEVDWPDGAMWALQSHHVVELLVPEGRPLLAGEPYATSAGMLTGSHEHSHFVWAVRPPGAADEIRLDPWLLFRQMLRDRAAMVAPRANGIIGRAEPAL
jgi:hypothetical protein